MFDTEQIAQRSTVEQIVKTYLEAEQDIRKGCALVAQAVDTLNERLGQTGRWDKLDFGRGHHGRFEFEDPEHQILGLRRQMWRAIVERLEVRRMLSIQRSKALDDWLAKVEDEISVDNVMGFFQVYVRDLPDMLTEAVSEVYEWLRPHNSRHVTNTEYELGERVIRENCLDLFWIRHLGAPHVSEYSTPRFRALENVFSALDGKGSISKTYNGELCDAISKAKDGRGQTEYFEFRWFKNGNVHLKMRRMDLVEKFNRIAGGRRLKHDNEARKQPNGSEAA